MSSLKSFINGLINESIEFEILSDNAGGPSRSKLNTDTDNDPSNDGDITPHRPLHKPKQESRWDSMMRSGQQLITPKRCTSPMRMPPRSFSCDIRFSDLLDTEDSQDLSKPQIQKSTFDLVDKAISVCSESPLFSYSNRE